MPELNRIRQERSTGDRGRARTCTPQLRWLMLDPVERRGPCLTSPISARLISHQSERDRSMEVGNYPTEGWRFWALLAGIAMIGLLGLVMVLVVRALARRGSVHTWVVCAPDYSGRARAGARQAYDAHS